MNNKKLQHVKSCNKKLLSLIKCVLSCNQSTSMTKFLPSSLTASCHNLRSWQFCPPGSSRHCRSRRLLVRYIPANKPRAIIAVSSLRQNMFICHNSTQGSRNIFVARERTWKSKSARVLTEVIAKCVVVAYHTIFTRDLMTCFKLCTSPDPCAQ